MLKRYVFKCFLNIITLGKHLMPSVRVFHSVAAAVSINRLPSFTVLLLLGTNDVVFADLRCLRDGTKLTVHIDIQVHHDEEF